tara:strand:+ start:1698 stop:2315 length:618 start_codon:yes stop_codon:yes gene_type:complete
MSESGILNDTGDLDLDQELRKREGIAAENVKSSDVEGPSGSGTSDIGTGLAAGAEVVSHMAGFSPTIAVGAALVVDFIGSFKKQAQDKTAQFQSTFGPFMVADNRQSKSEKKKNRQNDGAAIFQIAGDSIAGVTAGMQVHQSPQTIQAKQQSATLMSAIRRKKATGPIISENLIDGNDGYMPQDAMNTVQNHGSEQIMQRIQNHS